MGHILLFDVGNTNTKLAITGADNGFITFSFPTRADSTPDELGLKILQACQYMDIDARLVAAWVVSSVVPCCDALLRDACARFFSCPLYFVPVDLPLDLENQYARPLEVGADRLATAFAARRLFADRNLIIVDFGTATTVECVRDNAYLGGLICPGLLSSLEALGSKTARLPRISLEVEGPELYFGQSTVQSMNLGMVHGFSAMITGLTEKIRHKVGPALVVATGGHARKIAAVCEAIDEVRGDLLFYGLQTVWQENCPDGK
ncbi:MAG: pantothenate kinase [Deltaproteobacteria bacterium]|nr:MAG: pantothenate kinase [Deltaproteobacteria bacterium]